MMMTKLTGDRGPRGRSVPVFMVLGWVASLVSFFVVRELLNAVADATGWMGFSGALAWLNIALVLGVPALSALAGTLVMPPASLRGAKGALRHALVVVPVPVGFILFALTRSCAELDKNVLVNLVMVGVIMVGTLMGALLGRLLRRGPHRLLRDSDEALRPPS